MCVSFLIPVFNEEDRIGKTIESIINDTSIPYNIVIIDDNSSDNTIRVIEDYKSKADIILLRNDMNEHIALSLNKGIEYCNNYILRCDSGDLVCNNRAELQLDSLRSGSDLCYSAYFKAGIDNNITKKILPGKVSWHNKFYNYFCHSTLAIKKSSLIDLNKYSNLVPAEDFDLFLKALEKHMIIDVLDKALIIYDDFTIGISKKNSNRQIKAYQYIFFSHLIRKENNVIESKFNNYISYKANLINYLLHKFNRILYKLKVKETNQ
jgi:glycosyltransferase involved in cell wall biosynthesis